MGRIISKLKTDDDRGTVEVWTGSPDGSYIHLGTNDDPEPIASLTLAEVERLAVMLMAARARLLGWRQASTDMMVYLEAVDLAALQNDDA